jgi:hypothetical protein
MGLNVGVFGMFVTTSASCTTHPPPTIHLHIPICGPDDAHKGQHRPTAPNESSRRPTAANEGQVLALVRLLRDLVLFHVYNNSFFVFVLYYMPTTLNTKIFSRFCQIPKIRGLGLCLVILFYFIFLIFNYDCCCNMLRLPRRTIMSHVDPA